MAHKILITTSSFAVQDQKSLEILQSQGFEIRLNPFGRRLTADEAKGLLESDVVGMIAGVEPLTEDVLQSASALKVISRCGVGLDNVDLPAAAARGIAVMNTPDAPARAVAELTLGLMLGLLRRISQADRGIRTGAWKSLMGSLLSEQTVGIIGYGNIGQRVAKLARAFGAKVIAYDKYAAAVNETSLDDLLARSDLVTLHLPYTPENHHLLNTARLGAMKKGAFLVNAARGGLVDESALYEALVSGRLGGAALDCFEDEPYHGPLAALDQVLMTAHMGSYAKEARALMEKAAAENLLYGLVECGLASRVE